MEEAANIDINGVVSEDEIQEEIIPIYVESASDSDSSNEIQEPEKIGVEQTKFHKLDDVVMAEKKAVHCSSKYFKLSDVHEPLRQYLNAGDLRNIAHNKAITGNVINVLQEMLSRQYGCAYGLQNTLNGTKLRFKVLKDKPFVQV